MTCPRRYLVDDHFAQRTNAATEQALRDELARCTECAAWYERHLLFGALTGEAEPRERLLRAFGLPRRGRLWVRVLVPVLATSVAVLIGIVVSRGLSRDDGFTPRGAEVSGVGLDIYRVTGSTSARVGSSLSPSDALAFSYQNGAGKRWLMIFAVDVHGRVYWYHPAWEQASETPKAVPIDSGPGWHELPAAITQPLQPGRLEVRALFLDERLDVRQVETTLEETRPGALEFRRVLEVTP